MNCPKCGKENPTQLCNSCNSPLTPPPIASTNINVNISEMAIASFVCALFALACFVPGLISALDPLTLSPKSNVVNLVAFISVLTGGIAFILGIIALSRIGFMGGRITGYGFATIGVAIPPILLFLLFWFNIGGLYAATSTRMICGTNLSGLGKAMLIYSNDYDDEYPRAGGRYSIWSSSIPGWRADNRYGAYGLSADGSGGRATISSSFYLLVKYAEITPKSFICIGDYGTKTFNPFKYGENEKELADLWDFGPEPRKHCSYSYHMPYGLYALTSSSEPGMAVAADPSPWLMSSVASSNIAYFDPDDKKKVTRIGNAITHKGDGQNVLFMDNHVSFEKNSFCGVNDDNIYTYWDGQDIRRGAIPNLKSQPMDRLDSMLVNDLP
ncbi:MAG: DUF4190 domain-containing protein [Planctomycetes bacterium]|nr:DUF4190 domain-containing protein [Planctomycetota bacterium]